ncbi:MAG: enoyl-CoA hydratase/isomerase family protein, partial [Ilumatobacteraceae bacterium]
MTLPMVDEIVATMDALEDDETVHAVIVTGAGSAFCAGADLGNLQTATEESLNRIYQGFLRI